MRVLHAIERTSKLHDDLRPPTPNGVDRDPTITEHAQMERDGYLVVRNFVGSHQLAELLRWTAELEGAPEVPGVTGCIARTA